MYWEDSGSAVHRRAPDCLCLLTFLSSPILLIGLVLFFSGTAIKSHKSLCTKFKEMSPLFFALLQDLFFLCLFCCVCFCRGLHQLLWIYRNFNLFGEKSPNVVVCLFGLSVMKENPQQLQNRSNIFHLPLWRRLKRSILLFPFWVCGCRKCHCSYATYVTYKAFFLFVFTSLIFSSVLFCLLFLALLLLSLLYSFSTLSPERTFMLAMSLMSPLWCQHLTFVVYIDVTVFL